METDRGQSQNIYELFLKSEKIFQIVMFFWKSSLKSLSESEKTIKYLNKIIESTNIILQIPNKLANQELSLNPEKNCANPKKLFCYVLLAPEVCQRQRFSRRIQNGGVSEFGVWCGSI